MSKAVLISIRPDWCEKIASGQKTIEVRKTRPKIDTPFKCFIYMTKDKRYISRLRNNGELGHAIEIENFAGTVIGEFICDRIIEAKRGSYVDIPSSKSNMDVYDLLDYANDKTVYGWYISDLVIYDKPKELSDFYKPCPLNRRCTDCIYGFPWGASLENISCNYFHLNKIGQLTRAPQSWCYVEELK